MLEGGALGAIMKMKENVLSTRVDERNRQKEEEKN